MADSKKIHLAAVCYNSIYFSICQLIQAKYPSIKVMKILPPVKNHIHSKMLSTKPTVAVNFGLFVTVSKRCPPSMGNIGIRLNTVHQKHTIKNVLYNSNAKWLIPPSAKASATGRYADSGTFTPGIKLKGSIT